MSRCNLLFIPFPDQYGLWPVQDWYSNNIEHTLNCSTLCESCSPCVFAFKAPALCLFLLFFFDGCCRYRHIPSWETVLLVSSLIWESVLGLILHWIVCSHLLFHLSCCSKAEYSVLLASVSFITQLSQALIICKFFSNLSLHIKKKVNGKQLNLNDKPNNAIVSW